MSGFKSFVQSEIRKLVKNSSSIKLKDLEQECSKIFPGKDFASILNKCEYTDKEQLVNSINGLLILAKAKPDYARIICQEDLPAPEVSPSHIIVVVDTLEKLQECVQYLSTKPSIAFDLEAVCQQGKSLGELSLMLMHADGSPHIYVIDLFELPLSDSRISSLLSPLLSCTGPQKLCWDLRRDSEAVLREARFVMGNVLDLQILAAIKPWEESGTRWREPLFAALTGFMGIAQPLDHAHLKATMRESGEQDASTQDGIWDTRPLTKEMLSYASFEVQHFHGLKEVLLSEDAQHFEEIAKHISDFYLKLYTRRGSDPRGDPLKMINREQLEALAGKPLRKACPFRDCSESFVVGDGTFDAAVDACNRHLKERHPTTPRTEETTQDPLYKTRPCFHFQTADCRAGAGCAFAHGANEIREPHQRPDVCKLGSPSLTNTARNNKRKTIMCTLFLSGYCHRAACTFAHSTEELQTRSQAKDAEKDRVQQEYTQTVNQYSQSDLQAKLNERARGGKKQ